MGAEKGELYWTGTPTTHFLSCDVVIGVQQATARSQHGFLPRRAPVRQGYNWWINYGSGVNNARVKKSVKPRIPEFGTQVNRETRRGTEREPRPLRFVPRHRQARTAIDSAPIRECRAEAEWRRTSRAKPEVVILASADRRPATGSS